jgi:hypothetical protein
VALALALTGFSSVQAQTRWVIVNGVRLADAEVLQLARRACSPIPDGTYWLDVRTGAWGYAGQARAQGVFGEACHRSAAPTQGPVAGDGSLGPYATMRRAQQVADDLRRRGWRAVAFHNNNGYYVRARR